MCLCFAGTAFTPTIDTMQSVRIATDRGTRTGVRLASVWVVDGEPGDKSEAVGAFDLRVEPGGWTLTDPAVPGVERQWPWDDIGGLTLAGAAETPDGRGGTSLEVIVNGWPVHLVVPTDEFPGPGVRSLAALAPPGHVLDGLGDDTAAPDPVSSRRGSPSRGAALSIAVMVAATVGGAVLASTSGAAPGPSGGGSTQPATPAGTPRVTTPTQPWIPRPAGSADIAPTPAPTAIGSSLSSVTGLARDLGAPRAPDTTRAHQAGTARGGGSSSRGASSVHGSARSAVADPSAARPASAHPPAVPGTTSPAGTALPLPLRPGPGPGSGPGAWGWRRA